MKIGERRAIYIDRVLLPRKSWYHVPDDNLLGKGYGDHTSCFTLEGSWGDSLQCQLMWKSRARPALCGVVIVRCVDATPCEYLVEVEEVGEGTS
jgi:hypothetical protein